MALRMLVAVALVASALSAVTWTKQLDGLGQTAQTTMLYTTSAATTNCDCGGSAVYDDGRPTNGCVGSYWDSMLHQATNLTNLTACVNKCDQDSNCMFALHDTTRVASNEIR